MTTLLLIILAIIWVILTVGFVAIPVEVLVGSFKAFRHGGWKGPRPH